MFVKMLNPRIPIAVGDNVVVPAVGEVIEVSNSVGTSLIRGSDAEQMDTPIADALKDSLGKDQVDQVVDAIKQRTDDEQVEIKPKTKKNRGKAPKNKAYNEAPENK
jgi:hypothetical protein